MCTEMFASHNWNYSMIFYRPYSHSSHFLAQGGKLKCWDNVKAVFQS